MIYKNIKICWHSCPNCCPNSNCLTDASSCDVVVNSVSCVTFGAYDGEYLGQITVSQLVLYVVSMLPATVWLMPAAVMLP